MTAAEIILPKGLESQQRKRYITIVNACRENRGKNVFLQEILRIAQTPANTFYQMVTTLRLTMDYDALCTLRESFGMLDIENEHVEKAIKKIEEINDKAGVVMPRLEHQLIQRVGATARDEALKEERVETTTIEKPEFTVPLSGKQKACFAIIKELSNLPPEAHEEVLETAMKFARLG